MIESQEKHHVRTCYELLCHRRRVGHGRRCRRPGEAEPPRSEMGRVATLTPPTIDGKMEPGERTGARLYRLGSMLSAKSWDWSKASPGSLTTTSMSMCASRTTGAPGELLGKRARKNDDPGIVFDPSNEIRLTPPVTPAATCQTLFNSYPAVFDAKMIPSVGYTAMSWQGNWQLACSETKDYWIVEVRAEIKSFGFDSIKDGSVWRGLFCADMGDGYGFAGRLVPGGAFGDIPRHGRLRFKDASPVFQFLSVESIFTGKYRFEMAVTGPPKGSAAVTVQVRSARARRRPPATRWCSSRSSWPTAGAGRWSSPATLPR